MLDFKEKISILVANATNMDCMEINNTIEIPKEKNMGDYALPCFKFAKILKKAPQVIANEINDKIKNIENEIIEKTEDVNGYLNLYIIKTLLVENGLSEFDSKKNNYG